MPIYVSFLLFVPMLVNDHHMPYPPIFSSIVYILLKLTKMNA